MSKSSRIRVALGIWLNLFIYLRRNNDPKVKAKINIKKHNCAGLVKGKNFFNFLGIFAKSDKNKVVDSHFYMLYNYLHKIFNI